MDTLTLLAGLAAGLAALCLLMQGSAAANRYVERTGGPAVGAAATVPATSARAEGLPQPQRSDPPPQRYNALMMLMAGMKDGQLSQGAPIGGMAAVMIYQAADPYGRSKYNPLALRAMVIDKPRERLLGLMFVPEGPLPAGQQPTLSVETLAGVQNAKEIFGGRWADRWMCTPSGLGDEK